MAQTLDQLLSEPDDPTYYQCYPFLPSEGLMFIAAPTKSLKSMMALNVAYDIAEGGKMFGYWKVARPYSVLVMEQEIGKPRLRDRLQRIHAARSGAVAGLNIKVVSKDLSCRLDTPEGMARMEAEIIEAKPDVLVLDPLMWFHGQDENDNTAMHAVVRIIMGLNQKHHCSSIVVHHMGKPGEFRDLLTFNAVRGGSVLLADCDTAVRLSKPVKGNDTIVQLDFMLRSAETPPPLTMQLDKVTLTFTRRGAYQAGTVVCH